MLFILFLIKDLSSATTLSPNFG